MTERLYYADAYKTSFKARIVERVETAGREAIVLDASYFYPTSGGQPADHGVINLIPVVDVSVRDEDGQVLHWLESPPPNDNEVTAEVDWVRRFDHMQQHSGQHILSQAFIKVANAETVGFHLGEDNVTIDLESAELSESEVDQAETLANRIIWQNRPFLIHNVSIEEARQLPLRKMPASHEGPLRLIEIENFDLTACGGTHVSNAGEVGLIKVIKVERRSQKFRVEFRCGSRALSDYRDKNSIMNALASQLTTGQSEVLGAVERMQDELKQARRLVKKQQTALLHTEAERLLHSGTRVGEATIVTHVMPEGDGDSIRALGAILVSNPGVVALLGAAGTKSQLLFSKSSDAPGRMDLLLKAALELLDSARGGGSAMMAQGGGAPADSEQLSRAITRAEHALQHQV